MSLRNKVVLVTGASKGVGKGIAEEFCENGATVIVTSRPDETKSTFYSTDTLEEFAERMCSIYTGKCIPIRCDHSKESDVINLFQTIEDGYGGIDILINNVFSASITCAQIAGKKFYEIPKLYEVFDEFFNVGLKNHLLCSSLAAKLMIKNKTKGLIATISSEGGGKYLFNTFYGIQKTACDRMAADIAHELKEKKITSVSFWPGAVATEMYHNFLSKSQDPAIVDLFSEIEHPRFVGKCLVKLVLDPDGLQKSGQILTSTDLAREYGLTDQSGNTPSRRQHKECDEFLSAANKLRQ
ncbi:unnamed protein product [Bursaphelenchus xylophilus]|uniref:(pine wood nematode) hypothetical protein n=1 Tax=Bursaphelenchus xylophilus TaxID=6326 RepID=A0A1I7S241_BURXY|nr:unnamed protein product [Bursaphelenchus xylophilus]CAG9114937.1 unnamed protein product [Bursaphelenchus xylophilus]